MAQKRYWEYKADDLTIDLDEQHHGMILPGVYQGYDFGTQTDMNLMLIHSVTGMKLVRKDPTALSDYIGVLKTQQGVIINEDAPLPGIPIATAHASLPRIDVIYINHEYVDSDGGQPAFYGVVQGTPNATPVAPSVANPLTDMVIATLYVPAAIADLSDAGVIYTRAEVPTLANENYAHRNKVNRYTMQAQEADESTSITHNTGSAQIRINKDDSNSYLLPGSLNNTQPLTGLSSKPGGTLLKFKVTASGGGTITHSASPSASGGFGQIFNAVDEETLSFPRNTILYMVAQDDGTWVLVNYSLKPVWKRTNNFSALQQFSYGTGVKIKQITYTISSITYTPWILEIDASAQNHVLDFSNTTQMGGFDPVTMLLELGVINIINGFKTINSGLGNGADIKIKFLGAIKNISAVVEAQPLPVQTGAYIYCDNKQELFGVNYANVSYPVFLLAAVTDLAKGCTDFLIKVTTLNKFSCVPQLAAMVQSGGTGFTNTTFYNQVSSYRNALEALSNAFLGTSPTVHSISNVAYSNTSNLSTDRYTSFYFGKFAVVTFYLTLDYNRGGGAGFFSFDNIDGNTPAYPNTTINGQYVLCNFVATDDDGNVLEAVLAKSSSTKMGISFFPAAGLGSGTTTVRCKFQAIYKIA